jgi:uncharacterized membrane protein HdeD (DUF308 family)
MDVLQRGWRWLLGLGAFLSALGVLLIVAPAVGTLAVDLLVGWLLMVGGVAQLIHAFMTKAWRGFLLELLSGALYAIVGILLVFYPMAGAQALTLCLGGFLAIDGVVRIGMALRLRPGHGWGWVLLGGIVTLILAAMIWTQWPGSAIWVIGLLVGINLLFTGWSLTMMALAARGHEGQAGPATGPARS